MKEKYKPFLIFLVLFLSLFFFIPSNRDQNCRLQKEFKDLTFNGIVETKFIDRSQHSATIIVLRNFENGKIDTLSFFFDQSGTFDLISQLDTVSKKINSLDIYVSRKNMSFVSKVNFGCENK